jgi:hypothetical protein
MARPIRGRSMDAPCHGTVAEDGKSTDRLLQPALEPVEGQLGFGSCTGPARERLGVHIGEDPPSTDASLSELDLSPPSRLWPAAAG